MGAVEAGTAGSAAPETTAGPATARGGGFLSLLTLEQPEPDLFRGFSHEGAPLRAFGGQVAAHALVAAAATVDPSRPAHSLHSYFIRPGDTRLPIDYRVERIRDGGSFTTRRITAIQRDEAIFVLSASFHRYEDSPLAHQRPAPRVIAPPDAEPLLGGPSTAAAEPADDEVDPFSRRGFEVRVVRPTAEAAPSDAAPAGPFADGPSPAPGRLRTWMRVTDALPDDQHTHACALVYMSDLTLAHTTLRPHGGYRAGVQLTSLDHAVWFHRPFRADDWLLFDQSSPTAANARGLAVGEVYDTRSTLVATVVQEALIRLPRE